MLNEQMIINIKDIIFDLVIEKIKDPINSIDDVYKGAMLSTIAKLIDNINLEEIKDKLRS